MGENLPEGMLEEVRSKLEPALIFTNSLQKIVIPCLPPHQTCYLELMKPARPS